MEWSFPAIALLWDGSPGQSYLGWGFVVLLTLMGGTVFAGGCHGRAKGRAQATTAA
jgi:hypothetical protein